MLFMLGESHTPIRTVPHPLLFNAWKSQLEPVELHAIEIEFDQLIRRIKGRELVTARLLPMEICALGRYDWDGSPFMRIWEKACDRDRARTCWCFAVLLWEHMIRRTDAWQVKAMDLDDAPMAATKYFRCAIPNHLRDLNRSELLADHLLA